MPTLPPKPCTQPGCKSYATNKGRCDEHQREAWAGRGSGASRGYGWAWDRLKRKILKRDGYVCQDQRVCKGLTKADEVDHVVPKAEGGTDAPENLRSICTPCHRDKTRGEALKARGVGKK